MFTLGDGHTTGNSGTRMPLPMAIQRFFEREAYLKKQRPQTQRTPDVLIALLEDGRLALMDYATVITGGLRVMRHTLNYNHLFTEDQLVDIDMSPLPSMSLNESFNTDLSAFTYSIRAEEPTTDTTTEAV